MANEQEIKIPDIGGATNVDVIELLVNIGDSIKKDTPLVTLESDKASMEIPSPQDGIVSTMQIKVGDKVSEGDVILTLTTESKSDSATTQQKDAVKDTKSATDTAHENSDIDSKKIEEVKSEKNIESLNEKLTEKTPPKEEFISDNNQNQEDNILVFASPAVRRFARELGVNLSLVNGTGTKGRITKEDVEKFIKQKLSNTSTQQGLSLNPVPKIDFTKFGEIETKPLSKIKKLTGINLHSSWVNIPHVTQFDEADVTELENFRKAQGLKLTGKDFKITLLGFVIKIIANALVKFPQFNSSLDDGNLIYKKYYNIGFAVDTPNGLVVPVIRDVDKLSVTDIAKEMAHLSSKAREKGLTPIDMSGGCFTISSLGGIGGTAFTPIINAPEVAILGLSRTSIKPVFIDNEFKPRLMLPLSLSYDHRVIDGAEAARFIRFISESLEDLRQILM